MSLSVKNQSNQEPAGKWVRPPRLNTNLPVLKVLDYSMSIAEIYQEDTPLSRAIGPILQEPLFPSRFGLPEKHFGFHPEQVQGRSSDESSSSPRDESLSSPSIESSEESPSNVKLENHWDDSSSVLQDVTSLNASDLPKSAPTQSQDSPLVKNFTQKMNLPTYLERAFDVWLDQVSSPEVTLHYLQLDESNPPSSIETTNPKQETSFDCDSPLPESPFDFRTENCYDSE